MTFVIPIKYNDIIQVLSGTADNRGNIEIRLRKQI